jgi:hypothetical protein
MSELTTHTPEIQTDIVPATDVFNSFSDLTAEIEDARTSGDIEIIPLASGVEDSNNIDNTLTVYTEIRPTDISENSQVVLNSLPRLFSDISGLEFINPDVLNRREAENVQEDVIEHLLNKNVWYQAVPEISELIKSGEVTQLFRLLGPEDMSIDIVNFTRERITEERLADIRESFTDLYNLSGGALAEAIRAICILPESTFESTTLGSTRTNDGVIRVNEITLSDDRVEARAQEIGKRHNKFGNGSVFKDFLAHEMTHLIEGRQDFMSDHKFGPAVGWRSPEYHSFVDDYGNVVQKKKTALHLPNRKQQVIDKDGHIAVDVVDHFGREEFINAEPVSNYGKTDNREDLAEAVPAYLYGNKRVDSIRVNAINNLFDDVSIGRERIDGVKIEPISAIDFKHGFKIKPERIGIKTQYYRRIKTPGGYQAITSRLGKVTDDYGNPVDSVSIMQPITR